MVKQERKVYTIRWVNVKRTVVWLVFVALIVGDVLFVQNIIINPNKDLCPESKYVLSLFYAQASIWFLGTALALTIAVHVSDLPENKEKNTLHMLVVALFVGSSPTPFTSIGILLGAFAAPVACMKEKASVLYYTGLALTITPLVILFGLLGLCVIGIFICTVVEVMPKLLPKLSRIPRAIKNVFVSESIVLEPV